MPPADRVSESLIVSTFFVPREGNQRTQTFLYLRPVERLQVGLAYIWVNESVRLLGSYEVLSSSERAPGVLAGFAYQDAFENKVSPFVMVNKRYVGQEVRAEGYLGTARWPNETHLRPIGGVKVSLGEGFYGGLQYTGRGLLSFAGVSLKRASVALWVREDRRPGLSLSLFLHRH